MRLVTRGVSLSFGSRVVLRELDLSLVAPALVAIMGPSGSGKSTLLGLLGGQLSPDSGDVVVESLSEPEPNVAPAAWIVQSSPMLTHRTALDNVSLGPLSRGLSRLEASARAISTMDKLGVGSLAGTRVHRLSGGERQRLSVARAIASRASLVLADEPTASLDSAMRERVCDALEIAARRGALVIVATHDNYVSGRCDTVYELTDGRLARQ